MQEKLTLEKIIALIESGPDDGDYTEMRYESAWRYFKGEITRACMKAHHCNETTARMLLSCSYGKYQIMGQVIYEQGYRGNLPADFLNNDTAQNIAFDAYVRARDIRMTPAQLCAKGAREYFARRYNGPGNIEEYSAKIAAILVANHYILTE